MTTDLFKEHHPHTLSDYMARSMVGFSRSLVCILGKSNFALRAVIANTILSSFTMVLASRLHYRAVRSGSPERDSIEDLLCEASGTHFHIIVIRKFVELSRMKRIFLSILQAISICFFGFISRFLPKTAHRTLGYMYEKSISDYSDWIDAITDGNIINTPASQVAVKYWELKPDSTIIDVLSSIREDSVKYRNFEHSCAEIHNINKMSA
jgi:ubiquinol oxidase